MTHPLLFYVSSFICALIYTLFRMQILAQNNALSTDFDTSKVVLEFHLSGTGVSHRWYCSNTNMVQTMQLRGFICLSYSSFCCPYFRLD